MKLHLLISTFAFFMSLKTQAMGLNDLSVLMPLPQINESSLLISPYEIGQKGKLLSKTNYDKLINLVVDVDNEIIWKNQLKVIAIRLDPCFIEGTGPLACRRQIRLVWQPVFKEVNELSTRDAAIHSFYEFNDEEFLLILKEWSAWADTNKLDKTLPLVIHPTLKNESLNGKSWNTLRKIILKFCGENSLIRMTSMNVSGSAQSWIFTGLDIKEQISKEMIIPRINTNTQAITQSSMMSSEFWGGITPLPNDDHEFNFLIDDSMFFRKRSNQQDVKKAIGSLLSFENPRIKNTGNLDCASCHLANMAHQWTKTNYPSINWEIDFKDVQYKSRFNLENTTHSKVSPNQFRIFGYFGKEPAISQRIINETAEVAELIRQAYTK